MRQQLKHAGAGAALFDASRWLIQPYLKEQRWHRQPSSNEAERIRETIAAVPGDVKTVLDVGCGSGWISNRMMGRWQVAGVDYSLPALKYVKAPRVRAETQKLPFKDNSFDLVIACEVLEHLPDGMLKNTLKELARVAAKYILITVPNSEDLESTLWKCPACGTRFNPSGHVQSFCQDSLLELLDELNNFVAWELRGLVPYRYSSRGAGFARFSPAKLGFWGQNRGIICPDCGLEAHGNRSYLHHVIFWIWELAVTFVGYLVTPFDSVRPRYLLLLAKCSPGAIS